MTKRAVCPNCGCPLKPGAVACLECGSDENTGWKDAANSEHPDISPFDTEDYQDLHRKEFGNSEEDSKAKANAKKRVKAILIGLLLVSLAMLRVCRSFK